MSNEKRFVLSLLTKTWVRDSHGLYDYESTQTKNLNAVLADSVIIVRKKHDITTITNLAELSDEELLINVKYEKQDKYTLENQVQFLMEPSEKNIVDLSNKIWYVIKCDDLVSGNSTQTIANTNDDYYLCRNDIIKLGRVKYALNEIHIPEKRDIIDVEQPTDPDRYNISSVNINSQPVFDFIFQANCAEEGESEENICKICYGNSNERDNPLVHLCHCSGGIRWSHFQCIKKWMETKLTVKENDKKTVKSYNIKSFNCEICKTPYPFRFKIIGRDDTFDLIDIERPTDKNYIILESLNQVKDNSNIKSIHVINLNNDNESISVGRGHESDVRINDISVSRSHAVLRYSKETGRLLLRDLKSKFGTLILFKRPLEIKKKKIHLQIGRTYIEAMLMGMEEFEKIKKEKKNKWHGQQKNPPQNPPPNPQNDDNFGEGGMGGMGGMTGFPNDANKMDIDN